MDEYGKIKIEGYIGRLIENCIGNGVMAADYQPFIKAFQEKLDSEGLFCGEFWGKWFTSAALAYEYNPRPEYLKKLEDAVEGLLAAQEEDGRISASKEDFTPWDIWGRKYALLEIGRAHV